MQLERDQFFEQNGYDIKNLDSISEKTKNLIIKHHQKTAKSLTPSEKSIVSPLQLEAQETQSLSKQNQNTEVVKQPSHFDSWESETKPFQLSN